MTLNYLTRSGGESEIIRIGVSVVAPFKESEQLRSHDETSDFNVETDQPRCAAWIVKQRPRRGLIPSYRPVRTALYYPLVADGWREVLV